MAQQSNNELSILIPVYNYVCVELVNLLHQQAVAADIDFEIIVADDGSTSRACIDANSTISRYSNCRFIPRTENIGRAAIRNFLAREARYAYLLYIDCDMAVVSPNFLLRYLGSLPASVVDGGVTIFASQPEQERLLRYCYEKAEEPHHTAQERQKTPYQHLHTANLLIRRDIMLQHPFDERLRHYGYEDVLLGKTLHRNHITITHIDNPLGFCTFEQNADFVAKTEEGLRTLYQFRSDLRGYSRLLTLVSGIHIPAILWLIRLWHQLFGQIERRNLCGSRPYLLVFKLYRLGYYLNLLNNREG
ncbi:MAG: glycosyltransferase family 2 protein [Prevotella sp.]|nr:glycosyltransferase family 2 protein [Prevotella sp.]